MNLRRLFLSCMLFLIFGATAMAQKVVSGVITDSANNAPLQSVTILAKGTKTGTQTANDGRFTLTVPANATMLVITSVGYGSKEVAINSENMNISLSSSSLALSDVVVIGYGTTKKKDLTGSIATVGEKDFQKGTITTPDQLIAGKVAGVQVISNGGAPGAGSTIRIRGGASLNASNDPLIVIDGIPLSGNGIAGVSNQLAMINPNDIETFTILKDAASTAIYGSRASNGVILITTKKGRSGKPVINFNTSFSVATIAKKLGVLSGDGMRSYVNNYADSDATKASYKDLLGSANTDWQKEIFQNAITSDNNLSITGAVKNIPYRVSVGYLTQQGILQTDHLQRGSAGIGFTPMLFDNHLKIDVNIKGTLTQSDFANQGAIGTAVGFDPTQSVYNDKGGYFEWTRADGSFNPNAPANPVGLINQFHSLGNASRSIGNAQFDYKVHFFPDLHLNVNVGYDISEGHGDSHTDDSARQNSATYNYRGTMSHYKQTQNNYVAEFYLNYLKDLKQINANINAIAGYGYYDNSTSTFNFPSYFLNKDTVPQSVPTYVKDIQQNTLLSYYGRLIYTQSGKYILAGSIRTDGSSRFAKSHRWGVFPSAAFTWRINQENFLKNSALVSDLKLRLSYGVTGQQDGLPNYSYLPSYYKSQSSSQYQLGNIFYYVYSPSAYTTDIKWEQTAAYNAGIDFGLFKNRITASVDVYSRKTKDLLSVLNIPLGTNFSNQIVTNIGDMNTKGVEVLLNVAPIVNKNFRWDVSYNFAYNDRKITKLTQFSNSKFPGNLTGPGVDVLSTKVQINSVGAIPNAFYVYKQVYDKSGNPVEGLYADLNRDGIINSSDLYKYKSPFAPVLMGFTNTFTYKQWSLSTVLRASIGNYMDNQVWAGRGQIRSIFDPNGFVSNVPSASLAAAFQGPQLQSDYYVTNASFLKMDNLGLSYNAGKVFANKANLILGANCQNVFVVTKYKGLDPEVYNGVDQNIYPRPRTYSISLNLNF